VPRVHLRPPSHAMQQATQPHTPPFISTANGIIVNIIITVITIIIIIIIIIISIISIIIIIIIIIIITTIPTTIIIIIIIIIIIRFEVDNSLTIDDPHAVAEHAQVPPPAAPPSTHCTHARASYSQPISWTTLSTPSCVSASSCPTATTPCSCSSPCRTTTRRLRR